MSSPGMEDLLTSLLGSLGFETRERGDLRAEVQVTLEEVLHGVTKELSYTRLEPCSECGGSLVARRFPALGCSTCAGQAVVPRKRTLSLDLPAGIESGASLVVGRGGNQTSPVAPAGDLHVRIQVAPHAQFEREGADIHGKQPISFATAALGGVLEVSTLRGRRRLRVAPGTGHGARLRMRGQGLPRRYEASSGDHFCELELRVPVRLNPESRTLLEQLRTEFDAANREGWYVRLWTWLKSLVGH